jgi:predicted nucleic acid-binding protein
MGQVAEDLKKYKRIAFDTNLFIYLMEKHEKYFDAVKSIFTMVEKGQLYAITSVLVVTELLTKPIKDGNKSLIQKYKAAICTFPNLEVRNVDYGISVSTAKIRAKYGFKTPDAIFIATAIEDKAEAFVTNDTRLKSVDGIDIIILDDYFDINVR